MPIERAHAHRSANAPAPAFAAPPPRNSSGQQSDYAFLFWHAQSAKGKQRRPGVECSLYFGNSI